jgi:hypothetical protein
MLYAIQYIGSICLKAPTADDLKLLALQHINHSVSDAGPQQIYQVSAMLMLTITAYGQGESTEARELLEKAILQSTSIGMGRTDLLNHQIDQEFSGLWKRIYWYLYITATQLSNIDHDHYSLCVMAYLARSLSIWLT